MYLRLTPCKPFLDTFLSHFLLLQDHCAFSGESRNSLTFFPPYSMVTFPLKLLTTPIYWMIWTFPINRGSTATFRLVTECIGELLQLIGNVHIIQQPRTLFFRVDIKNLSCVLSSNIIRVDARWPLCYISASKSKSLVL